MRRRILRAALLAVACAVLLFALPLGAAALRLYQQDEEQELQQLGERVALSLPAQLHNPRDPIELPRTEGGTRIAVYTPDGRRVLGTGPGRGDPLVRQAAAGGVHTRRIGDSLVAAVPAGGSEQVRAIVRVSSPSVQPLQRAAVTWAGMLTLAGIAVGVGVLLALRSSRRLARPLETLAGTARELEDGDLTARAGPTGLPEADEVATALARAAARIEDLLRRERAFSADASHQLRTALTGVRLELEASLVSGTGPEAAIRSALLRLERMEATLTDLLSLARDVPERAPLDVPAVLTDAERRWHGVLAAEGRRLDVPAEDDLPPAVGSQRAARQILDVLLANAAAHGRGTVRVRAHETAGVLAIDVEDEGDGIPEGADVFVRRHGEAAGGHGIGLALARSLAEAEGGRLFVARPRPHACFTWLLAAPAGTAPSQLP
ncbi:HAMP domain-containing sensor histidine kinase [Streptomyces sp. DSM 41527]|uniref:histidine kinase n=1 Tax=Streptomyces mooreae TaxID=3075523 RepID=A0ABU2T0N2_9ACTN|nr:HAMP domain-containing sensor histidine kinase [Streptomyces sp. DSM 41527]MDT0454782.1 HAMP domain-containing sensor histidine kinase [Streptomyces sp. DSM 41527]